MKRNLLSACILISCFATCSLHGMESPIVEQLNLLLRNTISEAHLIDLLATNNKGIAKYAIECDAPSIVNQLLTFNDHIRQAQQVTQRPPYAIKFADQTSMEEVPTITLIPVDICHLLKQATTRMKNFYAIMPQLVTHDISPSLYNTFYSRFNHLQGLISLLQLKNDKSLHQAIDANDLILVRKLLTVQSNVIRKDEDSHNAFYHLERLLEHISKQKKNQKEVANANAISRLLYASRTKHLFKAIDHANYDCVQKLLINGANPNSSRDQGKNISAIDYARHLYQQTTDTGSRALRKSILDLLVSNAKKKALPPTTSPNNEK